MNKDKLFEVFNELNIDAIISDSPQTRLWYSNISTTDGWLVIESNLATLFVDGRYYEYATKHAQNVSIELLKGNSFYEWLQKRNFKKIAIESDYVSVDNKEKIKKITKLEDSSIVNINAQKLRILKSSNEIINIQKAIDISLDSLENVMQYLVEGVSEKEIQHKLEYIMCRKGAEKEAFDSIVAFGANTAEPHHHSSLTTLKKGDMVTIDFGAKYKGFCADITRTFIFQNENKNEKYNEILQIVEEAANLGRQAVRPGIKASEIDNICRSYISSKGYSNFFVHSTGHGLGIDVHEYPFISQSSDIILEEGMVITIEPGIYVEGIGGARIEDDVLVTSDGARILSRR